MQYAVVNFSEIAAHPTHRMDAAYHVGKRLNKKAYRKVEDSMVVEDDVRGTIMLTERAAVRLNALTRRKRHLESKIRQILSKHKI